MPQDGSARPAASNPAIAWLNQKEWSMATARVNSFCAAGLQEVGKFTVPSFSGSRWTLAGTAKRTATETAMAKDRMVFLLLPDTRRADHLSQRTCQRERASMLRDSWVMMDRLHGRNARCAGGHFPRPPCRGISASIDCVGLAHLAAKRHTLQGNGL